MVVDGREVENGKNAGGQLGHLGGGLIERQRDLGGPQHLVDE